MLDLSSGVKRAAIYNAIVNVDQIRPTKESSVEGLRSYRYTIINNYRYIQHAARSNKW